MLSLKVQEFIDYFASGDAKAHISARPFRAIYLAALVRAQGYHVSKCTADAALKFH